MQTPRECVENVLFGRSADRIPFTMYENKLFTCETERRLRNEGLCIVNRTSPLYRVVTPDVQVKESRYRNEKGAMVTETHYCTPVGELSTVTESGSGTSWRREKMFKSPDDYKAIAFLLADERYVPNYESAARSMRDGGDDVIWRGSFGSEPLQTLISGAVMDMETFCYEWMDHQDEILKLYDILVENRRKVYPIVAAGPYSHANYGGNVVPMIVTPEMFERYYLPNYAEAAEAMHKAGKKIGSHFDADCAPLKKLIAASALDYIEAFTPFDTDMTLSEGCQAWPDKILWINYPSSWHLLDDAEIEARTVKLFDKIADRSRILVGITENVPPERWQSSCSAIMRGLKQVAR